MSLFHLPRIARIGKSCATLLLSALIPFTVHNAAAEDEWDDRDFYSAYDIRLLSYLWSPTDESLYYKTLNVGALAGSEVFPYYEAYYGEWDDFLFRSYDKQQFLTGTFLPDNYHHQRLHAGTKLRTLPAGTQEYSSSEPRFNPNHSIWLFAGNYCNKQIVGSARGHQMQTVVPGAERGHIRTIEGLYVTQGKTQIHTVKADDKYPFELINDDARSMLINMNSIAPGTRIMLADRPISVWKKPPGWLSDLVSATTINGSDEILDTAKGLPETILKAANGGKLAKASLAVTTMQVINSIVLGFTPDFGAMVIPLTDDIIRGYLGITQSYMPRTIPTRIAAETRDDFTVVEVKESMNASVCVTAGQLTNNFDGRYLRVSNAQHNGILGKISTVIVTATDTDVPVIMTPPDVVGYEDNGCNGNIKGLFNSANRAEKLAVKCPLFGDCVNDEIRSLRIMPWANPGLRVIMHDAAGGGSYDDSVVIQYWSPPQYVKSYSKPSRSRDYVHQLADGSMCIGSLEKNFFELDATNGQLNIKRSTTVRYFEDNGLDGKVSRVSIRPALSQKSTNRMFFNN